MDVKFTVTREIHQKLTGELINIFFRERERKMDLREFTCVIYKFNLLSIVLMVNY